MDKYQGERMLSSERDGDNLFAGQFLGTEGTVPVLCWGFGVACDFGDRAGRLGRSGAAPVQIHAYAEIGLG